MGLVIKFSETLLILQVSPVSGCISQMKVWPILHDAGVTIQWYDHVVYKDTYELEAEALLLSGGRDNSQEVK